MDNAVEVPEIISSVSVRGEQATSSPDQEVPDTYLLITIKTNKTALKDDYGETFSFMAKDDLEGILVSKFEAMAKGDVGWTAMVQGNGIISAVQTEGQGENILVRLPK
jgi:hypothetical protein